MCYTTHTSSRWQNSCYPVFFMQHAMVDTLNKLSSINCYLRYNKSTEKLYNFNHYFHIIYHFIIPIVILSYHIFMFFCSLYYMSYSSGISIFGRVAQWLVTWARTKKVPGSSPAASYLQRLALCSNGPANV